SDNPQQGRLSRPRCTKQTKNLTDSQLQIRAGKYLIIFRIGQMNVGKFNGGHTVLLSCGRMRPPTNSASDPTTPKITATASAIPKFSAPGRISKRTIETGNV